MALSPAPTNRSSRSKEVFSSAVQPKTLPRRGQRPGRLFHPASASQRRDLSRHLFQPVVADAQRLEMLQRAEHVVLVLSRLADGAANDGRRIRRIERTGILLVVAIN